MHPRLGEILLERKNVLGEDFRAEVHVISFMRDTLSDYFARAIDKAGVDKPGAVHILRHTVATAMGNRRQHSGSAGISRKLEYHHD